MLRLCDAEYPAATTIVVGGSASTGRRTPTSDIDVLLIAPTEAFGTAGRSSEARVVHREGERFDVFAYTEDAYGEWAERDFASLRPVLPYLLTEGLPVRSGTELEQLHRWSKERLLRGPEVSAHDLALRRYAATDLIDDLADATDPLARATIHADLLRSLGELALLTAGAWLGSGKWLARRLREADEARAVELAEFASETDPARAAALAERMLDGLGGRVDGDFTR